MSRPVSSGHVCYLRASPLKGGKGQCAVPDHILAACVLATTFEASGDAIIRIGLGPHLLLARVALMLTGAVIRLRKARVRRAVVLRVDTGIVDLPSDLPSSRCSR